MNKFNYIINKWGKITKFNFKWYNEEKWFKDLYKTN